jgi:hypothetical protein
MTRLPKNDGVRLAVYLIGFVLLMIGLVLVVPRADAQTVPGSMVLRWTLPTTGCLRNVTPPQCNQPLTGAAALQAVHVWISTSPIPDAPTGAPTLTLGAGATTATHTVQVTNGQTLYARVSARNADGNSPLSGQVARIVTVPVIPGVPTEVTIELTIAP